METDDFVVTREDNCIWVEDKRDGLVRHIIPEQASEPVAKLTAVLQQAK